MKKLVLLIVISVFTLQAYAYENVPVLVHLSGKKQSDTVGFNLVRALPEFFYGNILKGKIRLYDSPRKETQISPEALQNLEKVTKTQFTANDDLFLNELWTSTRKSTEFHVVGFSMINKDEEGKAISYGFIDAAEVTSLLKSSYIYVNANGHYLTTYWDALMSRRYEYNLVQFGNNDFKKDPTESFSIKADAFQKGKRVEELRVLPCTKQITYTIEKDLVNDQSYANSLIKGLEQFFANNPEEFFNSGGDKFYSYQKKLPRLKVTKIEVIELCDKQNNIVVSNPIRLRIYVNDKALNPIAVDQFNKYKLFFRFKSVEDICKEKQFEYTLNSINDQQINFIESPLYIKALRNYQWTQLTEYVKSLQK